MADSNWNSSTPASSPTRSRRRGFPLWITIPLALLVGLGILGFAFAGRATGLRRQAWPLVQAVHKRLSTDEGASQLYRVNPAFAEGYASEAAFLDAVRAWRPKFGALAPAEPQEDRDGYRVDSDPFELTVACRGSGGGWIRARFVTGPAAAGRNVGEGLSQLVFADSAKALQESATQARRQVRSKQWAEFRALLGQLSKDETALALFRSEALLRQGWLSEQEFLERTRAWRPALSAIPEDLPAPDSGGTTRVQFSRNHTPFGDSREIRFAYPGGAWKAVWKNGALATLSHKPG